MTMTVDDHGGGGAATAATAVADADETGDGVDDGDNDNDNYVDYDNANNDAYGDLILIQLHYTRTLIWMTLHLAVIPRNTKWSFAMDSTVRNEKKTRMFTWKTNRFFIDLCVTASLCLVINWTCPPFM